MTNTLEWFEGPQQEGLSCPRAGKDGLEALLLSASDLKRAMLIAPSSERSG